MVSGLLPSWGNLNCAYLDDCVNMGLETRVILKGLNSMMNIGTIIERVVISMTLKM